MAYDLIDDQALKASIAGVVTRMVQFLKDHGWTVVLPNGAITTTFIDRPDQQLGLLQLARHVNPDQFSTSYDISRVLLSPGVIAPISLEVLSDDSYFKFNLDTINLYTLIHLESSSFGEIYRKAYDVLRNHTDDHRNAVFNMIDRALNGPNPGRDAETRSLLDQWLQRPRRDVFVDNHGKYPSCGDQACNPIAVSDRVPTDYLWQRSPFQLSGGGSGRIENAGIDYILPYWMARYHGVLGADTLRVVSAASGASALAPERSPLSSARIWRAQELSTQPPPQSLGSVSVAVKDSAGVSRWRAFISFLQPDQLRDACGYGPRNSVRHDSKLRQFADRDLCRSSYSCPRPIYRRCEWKRGRGGNSNRNRRWPPCAASGVPMFRFHVQPGPHPAWCRHAYLPLALRHRNAKSIIAR